LLHNDISQIANSNGGAPPAAAWITAASIAIETGILGAIALFLLLKT
jgi:hypothetical protein